MRKPPQQLSPSFEGILHQPVLLEDVLSYLRPKQDERYLDLTAGYGGHAQAVLAAMGNESASNMTLVDRDAFAETALEPLVANGARFIRSDFLTAANHLATNGETFDMILADLGVSSPQLDTAERGFSFSKPANLDMRMDQRQTTTAADIVNHYKANDLERLLRRYGEERAARRITEAIIAARPITTTQALAECIEKTIGRKGKIHPATRTFQALRIAVNQELDQIEQMLPLLPRMLRPGGRVVVISFHSLEDRIVKRYFAEQSASGYEAELEILTKHPIKGNLHDATNPRARSACLRAAVKIKRKGI